MARILDARFPRSVPAKPLVADGPLPAPFSVSTPERFAATSGPRLAPIQGARTPSLPSHSRFAFAVVNAQRDSALDLARLPRSRF